MQAGAAAGAYNTAADAASRVADKTTGTARQVSYFHIAQQCIFCNSAAVAPEAQVIDQLLLHTAGYQHRSAAGPQSCRRSQRDRGQGCRGHEPGGP